jgi:hypothetical protein
MKRDRFWNKALGVWNMGRWDGVVIDDRETVIQQEPLGKRVGRFVTLLGIVFAVSGGVVVTQRLSEDALALLLGLSCGIAAMLPTVVLGGMWLKRELGRYSATPQPPERAVMQPPVIVVTPQALPGYGQGYGQAALPASIPSQWLPEPAQREFKIVGGVD